MEGGIRGRDSEGKGGKGRERDRGRGEGGSDRGRGVRSINNVGVYIYAAQNNVMSIYQRPTHIILKKSLPWYASDPSFVCSREVVLLFTHLSCPRIYVI